MSRSNRQPEANPKAFLYEVGERLRSFNVLYVLLEGPLSIIIEGDWGTAKA